MQSRKRDKKSFFSFADKKWNSYQMNNKKKILHCEMDMKII